MKLQNFEFLDKLGEGAYSSVYKVKRTVDQQFYALKKVSLSNLSLKEKENALNEVRIIASIKHPNVVSFKECFVSDDGEYLYLIMDYADDGDVLEKIKKHYKAGTRLREEYIWNIFIQSIKGLQVLHSLNVYHRDIKSANLFLYKDGTTKIGDFNVSKQAKMGLLYTQTGTPYYASPEVWSDQPYTSSSDIWSMGCVLYELATLSPPFNGDSMKELYGKVMGGVYKRISPKYSNDLTLMIQQMLQIDPKKRLSCTQILDLSYVKRRIGERRLLAVQEEEKSILLKTIQFKQATASLQENLPLPNYQTQLKTAKKTINEFLENVDDIGGGNNENSLCLQPSLTIKSPKDNDSSNSRNKNDQSKGKRSQKVSQIIPSMREIKSKKQIVKDERSRSKNSIQMETPSLEIEGKRSDNNVKCKTEELNNSITQKKQKHLTSNSTAQNTLKREQTSKELQSIRINTQQRGRSPMRFRQVQIQEQVLEIKQDTSKDKKYEKSSINDQYNQKGSMLHQHHHSSSSRKREKLSNHSQDHNSQNGRNIFLPILYQNKQFMSSSNSPPLSKVRQETYSRKILQEIYSTKLEDQNKMRSMDQKRKNNQLEINKCMRMMPSLSHKYINQSGDFSVERQSKSKSSRNERIQPHQSELQRQIGLSSIEEKKEDNQLKESMVKIQNEIQNLKALEKQKSIDNDSHQQSYQQIKSYKRFNYLKDTSSEQTASTSAQSKQQQNSQSPHQQNHQPNKNQFFLPSISKSYVLQNSDTEQNQLQPKSSVNKFKVPTTIIKKMDLEEQSSSNNSFTKKKPQFSSVLNNNHTDNPPKNNQTLSQQ